MRRIVFAFVAIVLAAVAVLGALPLLMSGERVRQQIVENIAALTGREITFRDAPRITFMPFLGIELHDVAFKDAGAAASDPPLVRMERLQGQLRIMSAITGRAEVSSFRFLRPQFSVRVGGDGKINWNFPQGRIRSVLNEARAQREAAPAGSKPDFSAMPSVPLGRMEIIDGTIEYENANTGHKETFTNVNGQVSWPSTFSTWSMSGKCIWRNEAVEFSASSSQPLLLLSGGTAPASVRLNSGALGFTFEGEANLIADLHLAGKGQLVTPSLRRFAGLFGSTLPPGSTLSQFSIAGKLDATPSKLAFTEADITLDGNAGRGALQLSVDKVQRPRLSGTIAAGQLNLTPYLADLATSGDEPAGAQPTLPRLDMELDLRLSAASAQAGKLALADVAATVSLHKGEGVFELGNATVLGGTLTGQANLRKQGEFQAIDLSVIASGMDAAVARKLLGPGHFSISGTAGANAKFSARGRTLSEIRQAFTGDITARVENGVLYGADFAELLRRAESQTQELPKIAGETAFRTLEASVRLNRNFAEVNRIIIANSKVTAQIAGRAELDQGGLALRILVTPSQSAAEGAKATQARAVIGGSLNNPVLTQAPAINGPDSTTPDADRPEPDPVSLAPAKSAAN